MPGADERARAPEMNAHLEWRAADEGDGEGSEEAAPTARDFVLGQLPVDEPDDIWEEAPDGGVGEGDPSADWLASSLETEPHNPVEIHSGGRTWQRRTELLPRARLDRRASEQRLPAERAAAAEPDVSAAAGGLSLTRHPMTWDSRWRSPPVRLGLYIRASASTNSSSMLSGALRHMTSPAVTDPGWPSRRTSSRSWLRCKTPAAERAGDLARPSRRGGSRSRGGSGARRSAPRSQGSRDTTGSPP